MTKLSLPWTGTQITELLLEKHRLPTDASPELIARGEEFKKVYQNLPQIADGIVNYYKELMIPLDSGYLDKYQLCLFLVGGRVKGKLFTERSDIDLMFESTAYGLRLDNLFILNRSNPVLCRMNHDEIIIMQTKMEKQLENYTRELCNEYGVIYAFHFLKNGGCLLDELKVQDDIHDVWDDSDFPTYELQIAIT